MALSAAAGAARPPRYRVLARIRGGGQGSVLLAHDRRLQRQVAIKLYRLCGDAHSRRRVLREARLLASVCSPHVAQLYDLIRTRRGVALVLQYVPGCDLQQLLDEAALPLHSSLLLAADVAAGLVASGAQDLTHGDLKPANIVVGIDGRSRIIDFGIAVRGRAARPLGGSIYALAPEHLRGGRIDPRTDLFGLGVLLYHLLAGRHPFAGTPDWPSALLAARYAPLPRDTVPDRLRTPLDELLQRLLQVNPAARGITAAQANVALLRLCRLLPAEGRQTLAQRALALCPLPQRPPSQSESQILSAAAAVPAIVPAVPDGSESGSAWHPPCPAGTRSGRQFRSADRGSRPAAWTSDCLPSP